MRSEFSNDPPLYAKPPNSRVTANQYHGGGARGPGANFGQAARSPGWGQAARTAQPSNQNPSWNPGQPSPNPPRPNTNASHGSPSGGFDISGFIQPDPEPAKPDPAIAAREKKLMLHNEVVDKCFALLQEQLNGTEGSIKNLLSDRERVDARKAEIENGIDEMNNQIVQLEETRQKMTQLISDKRQWLSENEGQAEVDPDEAIKGGDAYSEQLMESLATDNACEDTMYQLKNAFCNDSESFDIRTYIQGVRKVARDQFMAKALNEKILIKQKPAQMSSFQARAPAAHMSQGPPAPPLPGLRGRQGRAQAYSSVSYNRGNA